jgi:hypothetical protein
VQRHKTLNLCTDNCSSQFKCKFSLWWWAWWACVARPVFNHATKTIRHVFQLAGHTKFAPDRGFAAIRIATSKESVYTPTQLLNLINDRASVINHAIPASDITFINWKKFLEQFFDGSIDGILEQHELVFDADQPGVVQFRPNSMVGFHPLNLFKKDIDVDTVLRPKYCGLRQWDHPDFELANRPLEDDRIEQLTALVTDYAPNIPSYEAFTSFS